MISLDVLINAPTEDTIFNLIIAKLVSLGIPADQWRDRNVGKAIVRGLASSGSVLATLVSDAIRGTFVGRDANGVLLATGPWLEWRAKYGFGVLKEPATYAEGALTFSNNGGNAYSLQPFTLVVKNSSGKSFKNTALVTLNAGAQNISGDMLAVEQGTDSNTPAGDTWEIVSPADPNIVIANASALIATDEESDDDLTDACTAKLGALSLDGPRGAYAYAIRVALRDDNNLPVNVNRWQKKLTNSSGTVQIYLASATGAVDSHDIAGVVASIESIARPDTVTVNVSSAGTVSASGTLTVWAYTQAGLTADQISAAVNAALEKNVATYPIGGVPTTTSQGYLYAETIEGWAQAAHAAIFKVDYSGADVAIADGQVAELAATVNVRFVTVSQ